MTATDGSATSVAGKTRMLVRAPTAPICKQATPQTVRTGRRGYVDLRCTDDDGMPLPTVTDPPDHGDIVFELQGQFGYLSDPGYEGPDTFTVEAKNAHGTVTRTQQLTVDDDHNTAPICFVEHDRYTRQQPVEITGYCWDEEQDQSTLAISAEPEHGELSDLDPVEGTVPTRPTPATSGATASPSRAPTSAGPSPRRPCRRSSSATPHGTSPRRARAPRPGSRRAPARRSRRCAATPTATR